MNIDEVFEFAQKKNIAIDRFPFEAVAAMSLPEGCIGYDPQKFETAAELKSALAHEIGHIQKGAFYCACTPLISRAKCEYKADRYAVEMLLPQREIEEAIKSGDREIWQLAETFGVTEQLVRKACQIYFDLTA